MAAPDFSTNSLRKILLVQTGFIGDTILSTPVIDGIRYLFPQAELSLLTTPLSADLYRSDSRLSEVLVFDKRKSQAGLRGLLRMARELRARGFDAAFGLHKSARSSLLLRLAGIPSRFGFSEASLSFLYSKRVRRSRFPHDVQRNWSILENVGHTAPPGPMLLEVTPFQQEASRERLRPLPHKTSVALAPSSVWMTKRWTAEGFIEVGRMLLSAGCNVVLIGAPNEKEYVDEIAQGIGSAPGLLNVCGLLSLSQSAALIKACDVLVCNDSAPLHMASATQTPVVAMFCATVPAQGYGPWMTDNIIVEKQDLSCRPCGRHGGHICPVGSHACRRLIQSSEVFSAVQTLLERNQSKKSVSR